MGATRLLHIVPRLSVALSLSAACTPGTSHALAFVPPLPPAGAIGCGEGARRGPWGGLLRAHRQGLGGGRDAASRSRVDGGRCFGSFAAGSLEMSAGGGKGGAQLPSLVIFSWNVNSVNARLQGLLTFLQKRAPDVVVLQEIKCLETAFPSEEIRQAGYHVLVEGQKQWNGVAILSRIPPVLVQRGLNGDIDDPLEPQARYIEADVGPVRVCCVYLPNGNPVTSEKFEYKLRWIDRLTRRAERLLSEEVPFLLLGDFNVCPTDDDCWSAEKMRGDAVTHSDSRAKFRQLRNLGLTDALEATGALTHASHFTYWDYKARAFERDNGLRIDHVLMSPQAADMLQGAGIDREVRGWEKPSDHCPVWVRVQANPVPFSNP